MASWRRLIGPVVMTLGALVIAHNLVFLLAYGAGYDEALAHSGHGGAWNTAVIVILVAGLSLLALVIWRLYRLAVIARRTQRGEASQRQPMPGGFGRHLMWLWLRLAGLTGVLFVVQENLEHLRAGQVLPGLTVLGSAEYPNATMVIAAVAFAIALVGALFRWRRDVLTARIAAARVNWRGAARTVEQHQAAWIERRHASIVVHQFSGRAPPRLSTA
jgi:hypothetical protein